MTRLSLRIRRSPGRRISGKLRKKLSWQAPVARSRTSMRLEPRIAGGDWAISSSGRSKLKSDTRKSGNFGLLFFVFLEVNWGWFGVIFLVGFCFPKFFPFLNFFSLTALVRR